MHRKVLPGSYQITPFYISQGGWGEPAGRIGHIEVCLELQTKPTSVSFSHWQGIIVSHN